MKRVSWVWLLAVLVVAELAGSLETTMIFAALPAATRQFGTSDVGWLATGYLLVAGASSALCARLGDLFGRSQVLMAVLALAGLGSLVAAGSAGLGGMIAGRSIQGLAGAVLPLGYGLAREHLDARRLALGTGALTAAASFGAALGFVVGGVIVDAGKWQHVFDWSAAIVLFALLLCWTTLPRSPSRGGASRLDILGGLLFAPGVAVLLLAVTMLQKGHSLTLALALLSLGALGLVVWVWHELRHPQPLIDVSLLKLPQIALANLAGASVALGAYQILIFFPLLMQQPVWTGAGFGLSATKAGLLKLPCNLAAVAGALGAGLIVERCGGALVVLIGSLLCATAWIGLWFDISQLPYVVGMLCLSSAGATIVLAGVASVVMAAASADRTSEATGVTVVVRMIFQALGAVLIAALLSRWTIVLENGRMSAYSAAASFQAATAYIIAASLIGVLSALVLVKAERRRLALMPVAEPTSASAPSTAPRAGPGSYLRR